MQTTPILGLKKPENNEYVNVADLNDNSDVVDDAVAARVESSGGDISETIIETLETIEDRYPVPAAGERVKGFFGKVLTFLRNIRTLTGDIALYVSANTGSDISGDGSQAKPFKTIQLAINTVPKDLGGYEVIIYVADGIYNEEVKINTFHNGVFRIYSSNITAISTVCTVNRFNITQNNCYIFITGFNISTATQTGIAAYGSSETIIDWCSMTANATGYAGMYFAESAFQVLHCVVSNRYTVLQAYKSFGTSGWWGATSGNINGLYSMLGSTIKKVGIQPQATRAEVQDTGGSFLNENGTQISGMFTAGLSCTWGTISGGYIRHGSIHGVAMVTVQLSIAGTMQLTAGVEYLIAGFPPCAYSNTAVNYAPQFILENCFIDGNGYIHIILKADVTAAFGFLFNCTYLTNS